MKVSVVISEGYKQIMMTPESDHEKEALKFICPNDELKVVGKMGTFDNEEQHYGWNVGMSTGGVLRRFAEAESLMFVIEPKPKES